MRGGSTDISRLDSSLSPHVTCRYDSPCCLFRNDRLAFAGSPVPYKEFLLDLIFEANNTCFG